MSEQPGRPAIDTDLVERLALPLEGHVAEYIASREWGGEPIDPFYLVRYIAHLEARIEALEKGGEPA